MLWLLAYDLFPSGQGSGKTCIGLYCSSLKAVICPQLMLGIGLIPDDPMYHHTIVICRLLLANDTCGVPCSYHMYLSYLGSLVQVDTTE